MQKSKHIYQCPFTGKTPHGDGFSGQEWYEQRAELFIKYTLRSLMAQTEKDFLLWVTFRPQEKKNARPILQNSMPRLSNKLFR